MKHAITLFWQKINSVKYFITFLLLLIGISSVKAGHIMGGFISYQHIEGDSYMIDLTVIKNSESSTTGFDNPAVLGIFENTPEHLLFQVIEIPLIDSLISFLPNTLNDSCNSTQYSQLIQICHYVTTVQLPNNLSGYVLTYQRCCFTSGVNNAAFDQQGLTITTTIDSQALMLQNSSCYFNQLGDLFLCADSPFSLNFSVFDNDNDSISYFLCSSYGGATADMPAPNPPEAPPYSSFLLDAAYSFDSPFGIDLPIIMDPNLGILAGVAPNSGRFLLSVCAQETRDGAIISSTTGTFLFRTVFCEPFTDVNGNGICDNQELIGCMDSTACNYNASANVNFDCLFYGCTEALAVNYDPSAGCDDGSCIFLYGCLDPMACNYDATATISTECYYPGCSDPTACNFNPSAGCDDGSCLFIEGTIIGSQLVYNLDENEYTFPCDSNCTYHWSLSNMTGTNLPAGIILSNGIDCSLSVAWGNITGLASVELTVDCGIGCTGSYSYPVQLDLGVGNAALPSFSVYPNPFSSFLYFENETSNSEISVFTTQGNLVYQAKLNSTTVQLDLSFLSSGIYIVELTQNSNMTPIRITKI